MDKVPLLASLNSSSFLYPAPSSFAAPDVDPELPRHARAAAQSAARLSNEVEVLSGVKAHVRVVVDGMLLGEKLVKVQVFPESTVQAVFSTIRLEWAIDANALSLAGDKVRYVDQLVKENGALLLPRYPAALLFPDKGKNTAAIEVTFMYERLEKPCCSRCLQVALGITVLVVVIVRLRGYAVHNSATLSPHAPQPALPLTYVPLRTPPNSPWRWQFSALYFLPIRF